MREAAAEPVELGRGEVLMALEEGWLGRDSWSGNFLTAMAIARFRGFYAGELDDSRESAVPGEACFDPAEGRGWKRVFPHPSIARSGSETYFLGQAENGKIWKHGIVHEVDCLQCYWVL